MPFGKRKAIIEEEDYELYEDEEEEEFDDDADFSDVSTDSVTKLKDYDTYVMSSKEKIIYILLAAVVVFCVGWIFYQNVILALILSAVSLFFPKIRTKQIITKQKKKLSLQFKDMLYALSSSMAAGRSMESAFESVRKDLELIYPDPNTAIMQEITYIIRCIQTNMTVEDALGQFAARAHIEDIESFADVVRICKRSGGNLIDVIRSTSQMIGDKIETANEIETVITAKKFESRILTCTPIVMVALLSASSPEYMYPVFHTFVGRLVMTVAIVIFVVSFLISERIMKIEV